MEISLACSISFFYSLCLHFSSSLYFGSNLGCFVTFLVPFFSSCCKLLVAHQFWVQCSMAYILLFQETHHGVNSGSSTVDTVTTVTTLL